MRSLLVVMVAVVAVGCKKHAKPTLPQLPDSHQIGGGSTNELATHTLFHTVYSYPGHAPQAIAFYAPEMEKRGAKPATGGFADDNLVHAGGFGSQGYAEPKDPSRPGVWLAVEELPDETRIDIWESVPKP